MGRKREQYIAEIELQMHRKPFMNCLYFCTFFAAGDLHLFSRSYEMVNYNEWLYKIYHYGHEMGR